MTRICMVVYSNYPEDTRVRREAEALVARGDTVDVICLRHEDVHAPPVFNGVRIFPTAAGKYSGSSGLLYVTSYVTFFLAASLRLALLHLRNHYQVIQVHTMPDFLVFAALIPRLSGARVILDVHDLMPELYQSKYGLEASHWLVRLLTWMERTSIRFADRAIAVHRPHLNTLVSHGNPAEKFIILLNLPDPKLFSSPQLARPLPHNGFRLIYHGTVSKRHGLGVALAALAQLQAAIPNVQLQIIGVGDDMPRIREQVGDLDLSAAVSIDEEWVRIDKLLPIIREADMGVVPILHDAFTRHMLPTKLMEYAALGIPVVCSRTETVEAYFDETMVLFCQPGDAADLADKILYLYQHPDRRAQLAANARRFCQKYSWEAQVQRYYRLVDDLARQAGLASHKEVSP